MKSSLETIISTAADVCIYVQLFWDEMNIDMNIAVSKDSKTIPLCIEKMERVPALSLPRLHISELVAFMSFPSIISSLAFPCVPLVKGNERVAR